MVNLGNDWDELLKDEFKKEYYLSLREFLKSEYFSRRIYPPMNDIYNALRYTSFENTRVVILGQDPYHGYGQAHGLCFSVKEGTPPAIAKKYIQGARRQSRYSHSRIGRACRLGKARCSAA